MEMTLHSQDINFEVKVDVIMSAFGESLNTYLEEDTGLLRLLAVDSDSWEGYVHIYINDGYPEALLLSCFAYEGDGPLRSVHHVTVPRKDSVTEEELAQVRRFIEVNIRVPLTKEEIQEARLEVLRESFGFVGEDAPLMEAIMPDGNLDWEGLDTTGITTLVDNSISTGHFSYWDNIHTEEVIKICADVANNIFALYRTSSSGSVAVVHYRDVNYELELRYISGKAILTGKKYGTGVRKATDIRDIGNFEIPNDMESLSNVIKGIVTSPIVNLK